MAQTKRGTATYRTAKKAASTRNSASARRDSRNTAYMYDNTARQLEFRRQLEEAPRRQLSHEARKNRDKATHMNIGYVVFLATALCVCAAVLMHYLQLQSDLTARVNAVSRLEAQLNNLQLSNEEEYNRVVSSIDLEEIRKIAIGELGMRYAQQGQIVKYEGGGSDYMRRVSQ